MKLFRGAGEETLFASFPSGVIIAFTEPSTIFLIEASRNILDEIAASDDPLSKLPKHDLAVRTNEAFYIRYRIKDHPRKGGRCKWFTVNEQRVQGRLELRYAEALRKSSIRFDAHPKKRFSWVDDKGKNHWYAPDFYLPDSDAFIEIKGFLTEFDRDKMERVFAQNPGIRLQMLFEDDVRLLE